MAISLTLEEFLQRLLARQQLLNIAVQEDVKKIFPLKAQVNINQPNISVDLAKPISELMFKTVVRLVTLVYEERLD